MQAMKSGMVPPPVPSCSFGITPCPSTDKKHFQNTTTIHVTTVAEILRRIRFELLILPVRYYWLEPIIQKSLFVSVVFSSDVYIRFINLKRKMLSVSNSTTHVALVIVLLYGINCTASWLLSSFNNRNISKSWYLQRRMQAVSSCHRRRIEFGIQLFLFLDKCLGIKNRHS